MNKFIILTASIIRGEFHKNTIGKFYDYFKNYLNNYEIIHIINIDEPENLLKHFNKFETMYNYNEIIPKNVKKIFINEPNPGFLNAYKKLVHKVEQLNLINDNYKYYWLEDDWEPKQNFNFVRFLDFLNYPNSSFTFSNSAPLGSFRGGPFMTGSYFKNVFNIRRYMNDTCDPERQMQRWIRGGDYKNGNSVMHRIGVDNPNINPKLVNVICILKDNPNIDKVYIERILNIHFYTTRSKFDKFIKFNFHVLCYNDNLNISKYSKFKEQNSENYLSWISFNNNNDVTNHLNPIFNNLTIKYFVGEPVIFSDEWLGRNFNQQFNLKKWVNINDGTTYKSIGTYDTQLGNWKFLNETELRLKPNITMNKGFFSALAYIHQCLPHLEANYFNKGQNLNLLYYSHNYGKYPNFRVFGDLISLNYTPTINLDGKTVPEDVNCIYSLCSKKCNLVFKHDFKKANQYFFKYFKFDESIYSEVNRITTQFKNKKVLGLHYRGTDKNKVNWVEHVSHERFINVVNKHISKNSYDIIFLSTDETGFLNKFVDIHKKSNLKVIYYDTEKNNDNDNSIHINRLNIVENKIKEIKSTDNIDEKIKLEHEYWYYRSHFNYSHLKEFYQFHHTNYHSVLYNVC
jgi:hypothetical protein